jgi:hypothetical protein
LRLERGPDILGAQPPQLVVAITATAAQLNQCA